SPPIREPGSTSSTTSTAGVTESRTCAGASGGQWMKGIESLVLQRVCTSCFGAAIALGGLLGCDQEVPQAVETTASQTATAEQSHVTWRTYAGSPDSSSYSALDQINRSNVHQLEVAWTYPTNDKMVYMANPIVIDRVMYL